MYRQVVSRYREDNLNTESKAKNTFIAIPAKDVHLMLTRFEASRLYSIMKEADNEIKSLQMPTLIESQPSFPAQFLQCVFV